VRLCHCEWGSVYGGNSVTDHSWATHHWLDVRGIALYWNALLVDQEFGKVPFYSATKKILN